MRVARAPRMVGVMRIGFGLGTILSPTIAGRLTGLDGRRGLNARGWSLLFASREIVLGALAFAVEASEAFTRMKAWFLIGAVDTSDAVAWIHLSKRHPTVKRALYLLVPSAAGSAIAHCAAAARAE